MSRFYNSLLIIATFLSLGMQCHNRAIEFAQSLDLEVNPNPIIVNDGNATFELVTTFPAGRPFRKIDSLVIELTCELGKTDSLVGTSVLSVPDDWDGTTSLRHSEKYELTNLEVEDRSQLYFQLNLYGLSSNKRTDRLAISTFKNER